MAGFRACDNGHLVRRAFPAPAAWLALAFLVGFHPGNEVGVVAEDAVEARIESPFSCKGRPYGFYADPKYGCRAFHICNPQMINGKMEARIYSYYCPGDWVFDQLRFACLPPNATRPEACEEAERHYVINEAFTLRTKVLASRVSQRRFSCERITPGTYADMRSGCKSYFACALIAGKETAVRLSCPIPTVFDQRAKNCIFPDLATPCELSEMYFNVPDYANIKLTSKPSPMINLSPRGNRRLPRMPTDSVYRSPVGNKLLSSEVVLDGLGVKHIMAKHAVTASNGHSVLKAPPSNFSCEGRQYGYYADVELDCEYFHVCTVSIGSEGQRVFVKHSFRCDEGTFFDQEQFECRIPEEALPCWQAHDYYDGNSAWNE
ncbi:uncharacterized protein LOC119393927 [Rhipicephalus sanguineus]|uniref:Chitin-binding type-2 domain-containing protein n=1 Tax=Rhipicephalus sanguineus TaxID=34632 RepID=A0A9D4PRN1_RHISA|nr:uncharacterized protein LOC119393927 [Rhipicephalus sanguineus]KAH7951971.1 hypothetical protein HPB52_016048 [Rhipicephalus sanguineus]